MSSASVEVTTDDFDALKPAKGGLMVGIFVLTLLSSYIPFILGKARVKGLVTILSVGTCFAAGIILAGGFNHLLPDANGAFLEYFAAEDPENKYAEFPYAATIAIFVLLLLVALDKLIVEGGLTGERGHNHMDLSQHTGSEHNHSNQHTGDFELTPGGGAEEEDDDVEKGHGKELKDEENKHNKECSKKELEKHKHAHDSGNGRTHKSNVAQAWIFLVALSIHSVFDGLGLGAESDKKGFYGLLVAVLAHKLLDGFALGVPIFYANFNSLQTAIALVFCALMTPMGIGIGMAIAEAHEGSSRILTEAIILSISCGSFFYISLIELLPSGICQPGWLKLKLAVAFGGWLILAIIALWV